MVLDFLKKLRERILAPKQKVERNVTEASTELSLNSVIFAESSFNCLARV